MIDNFSRRIVGWSLAAQRDAQLTGNATELAVRQRRPEHGLIFHSDQGIENSAHDYRRLLQRNLMTQSMNRLSKMNDNAHMESFFHSMKIEYLYGKTFDTEDELRQTLSTYIQYYSNRRIHSSLGHLEPTAFELRLARQPCVR